MSMTPFSDEFMTAKVNSVYKGERSAGQAGVFVNLTLQLEENADTSRPAVRNDIQKHLLGVIQRRSNNVGNSALWVDSPPGSVSNLQGESLGPKSILKLISRLSLTYEVILVEFNFNDKFVTYLRLNPFAKLNFNLPLKPISR